MTLAALERLSTPAVWALGEREPLIMVGLLITGVALAILGICEAAGFSLLPNILPSLIACLGAMFAGIDAVRIYVDSLRMLGAPPGPLAVAVPSSSTRLLFFGAVLSGGGGILLELVKKKPDLSKTGTGDLPKTYHANRWWMRDRSGSVLIWNDQAQAWSSWVHGRDPGLPPGWS